MARSPLQIGAGKFNVAGPPRDKEQGVPELPEVETVRRGLQPVMEGARIVKLEARRPDLRRPLPADFAKRVEGAPSPALGGGPSISRRPLHRRRAADASRHVRLVPGRPTTARDRRAPSITRAQRGAHDHVVFTCRRAPGDLQRSAPFGLMLLVPRASSSHHPLFASSARSRSATLRRRFWRTPVPAARRA